MTRPIVLLAVLCALISCSDSSSGPEDEFDPPGPTQVHGFFLDDAVNGLQYRSYGGQLASTNALGVFSGPSDASIEFFVDGVSLGTVDVPRTRITPNDFGVAGSNIARLLQSLDTTPGQPGISLLGVDLAGTPIDFAQGSSAFGADPAVQAAVAAAAQAGGTGILLSAQQAAANLAASLVSTFALSEFQNRAYFSLPGDPEGEPCYIRFLADGTGVSICRDDIEADPEEAAIPFDWALDDVTLEIEISEGQQVVERVEVQKLGITGNLVSAQVTSECLTCNPNEEQTIELSVETFATSLELSEQDLDGQVVEYMMSDLTTGTISFVADGTGTLVESAVASDFTWTIGAELEDVLELRGVGVPGSDLLLIEIFLLQGSITDGQVAVASATVSDLNANGEIDDAEILSAIAFESVELASFD